MRRAAISIVTILTIVTTLVGLGPGDHVGRAGERAPVLAGVPFATVDGTVLSLDVYRPEGTGPHPAVIAVHGGSWRSGDRSQWAASAPAFTDAGFVVFAIDYRLSLPNRGVLYTHAPRDVRRAVDWVRARAADYQVDPDSIALIGSSAGAHLALIASQGTGADVGAVVAWSPPVNLSALARGFFTRDLLADPIRNYLGCLPRTCPRRYARMSPLRRIEPVDPPTFLAVSTDELIPARQVRAMALDLSAAGVSATLREIPGTTHGQGLRPFVLVDSVAFLVDALARD